MVDALLMEQLCQSLHKVSGYALPRPIETASKVKSEKSQKKEVGGGR